MINNDLYNKIILYIGDAELVYRPYFTVDEIKIPNYSSKEIYDHISLMVEGKILDGIFAETEDSEYYGYLVGGLTTETEYFYNQLKRQLKNES
ncbi:MAG: hypothetical protein K0Q49_769 [Haloplasmataceae bacterium]|nr:hypothetical protein [Haloplasmataceae bacterium]